jgi:hypothetical protein
MKGGPESGATIRPLYCPPETAAPKMPPSVRFQPKCNPIGPKDDFLTHGGGYCDGECNAEA